MSKKLVVRIEVNESLTPGKSAPTLNDVSPKKDPLHAVGDPFFAALVFYPADVIAEYEAANYDETELIVGSAATYYAGVGVPWSPNPSGPTLTYEGSTVTIAQWDLLPGTEDAVAFSLGEWAYKTSGGETYTTMLSAITGGNYGGALNIYVSISDGGVDTEIARITSSVFVDEEVGVSYVDYYDGNGLRLWAGWAVWGEAGHSFQTYEPVSLFALQPASEAFWTNFSLSYEIP